MPPAFGRGPGPLLKTLERSKSRSSSNIDDINKPALAEARQESANRLQQAWQDIFDRYIQNDELEGQDDEYDLATLEVVHDAGFLQREEAYEIGCFGLPGAMGQDDETSEEEDAELDEDDEAEGDATEDENQVIEVSSSEDEMGNWSHKIGEPAPKYFEQRRAQELSDRDMQSFLSWNATKAQAQRQREFSVLTRQLKQESVKPVSTTPSKWTLATRAESTKPIISTSYTPPASVKPESSSSSTIFPRPHGTNSSLRKTKPFYATSSSSPSKPCSSMSSSSITAAVQMTGGNSIHIQAAACESDSSGDELSILSPGMSTPTAAMRLPEVKKREDTVDVGLCFRTPKPSRVPQIPFRQCTTTPSAPRYKLQPVVEVIVKRKPPVASTSTLPSQSNLPKRSSPLKESRIASPPRAVILPPSPPASRSSQALTSPIQTTSKGKRKASPLLLSGSDSEEEEQSKVQELAGGESSSEDEMALPEALEPVRVPRGVRRSVSSTSPSPPSPMAPKTAIVQWDKHYFQDGPPVASTSSAPAKVRKTPKRRTSNEKPRQVPATVSSKRRRSPSPVYKRGEEPWRIRRPPPLPLPTPPPSATPSSRDSVLSDESDSDVFTLCHTPKRQMRRHPRRLKSESEDQSETKATASTEKKPVLKHAPHILSDDDDDELLLLPTPSKTPSTARKTVRKDSTSPSGLGESTISPNRSSVPRKIRVKTPPDEDSDESDDPLGCW